MNFSGLKRAALVLALTVSAQAPGETVYITDRFQAGLHEDKSLDSPILKTISTGTSLDVIKREKSFTYVRDQEGVSGWIDNSYLVDAAPVGTQVDKLKAEKESLESKLDAATEQLARLQSSTGTQTAGNQSELQQQLNSERLKTGELQIQIAELKKRVGQNSDNESLYRQIEELKERNKTLEIQLAGVVNSGETGADKLMHDEQNSGFLIQGWKRQILYFSLTIIFGMVFGVYAMDFYNRRRHGGFRV